MGQTFRGGVPYAVDVRRLNDAFPATSLNEGRVIKHEQLAEVLDTPKGGSRYYGVINSWIAQMKHSNGVYIIWEPATGVKVLDPAGLFSHGEVRIQQKIRQTGRAVKILAWVDRSRLDSIGQQRLDHQLRVASTIEEALKNARRDLAVNLTPVKSLPKPQLLKGA